MTNSLLGSLKSAAMCWAVPLMVWITVLCSTAPTSAQKTISIAVNVSEDTNGIFQSLFASSFRRLGDVRVVSSTRGAYYLFSAVVLCGPDPDCVNPDTYSISIRLSERFSLDVLETATSRAMRFDSVPSGWWRVDGFTELMAGQARHLNGYELTHMSWVVRWGRERYRSAAEELVAEIDSRCFEKWRLENEALGFLGRQGLDSDAARNIFARIEAREDEWLC